MLVIVIIGIMVAGVKINFADDQGDTTLKKLSAEFAGKFDLVAEYSMLNNIEIGVFIDKDSYQYLAYDGVTWTPMEDSPLFAKTPLPEGVVMELQLDDLPIEESLLTSVQNSEGKSLFDQERELSEQDQQVLDEKEKALIIPQIVIFSGGEITPFSLTFQLSNQQQLAYIDSEPPKYRVTCLYNPPLTIEGPVLNELVN